MKPYRRSTLGAALLALALFPAVALAGWDDFARWPFWGGNLHNTRSAELEWRINRWTAPSLHVKWVYTTHGDVSATPSVDDHAVYFPDFGGWLHKVDAATGAALWSRPVSDYTGIPGSVSRTTPALTDTRLFIGTLNGDVIALDKATGNMLWKTHADPHVATVVTESPIVVGNRVYVGVASYEEQFAADPTYPCCTFRGSVLALDAGTGAVLWKTYVVPPGYAGGGVWGSSFSVDFLRRSLYVTTGNNSTVPPEVRQCIVNATSDQQAAACIAPDDYFDAILSLDLDTGAIKWGRKMYPADIFILSCLIMPELCPAPGGPDYDFGQGAALFWAHGPSGEWRELVGAGQKSGIYWALDPSTGATVWSTQVGPGSYGGGMMWGSAVADNHVYAALTNQARKPYTLQPSGVPSAWGNFTGMDAFTGQILWQTPDPTPGAVDSAPVSAANDLVFGCSMDPLGHYYALDGHTGAVLWSFASGGSCNGGPAIVNGSVYWGSGYSRYGAGTPNNKVYAFTVW